MLVGNSDLADWEPVRYAGREGRKGKGGRRAGTPMSADAKTRIAEAQKQRWSRIKSHNKSSKDETQANEGRQITTQVFSPQLSVSLCYYTDFNCTWSVCGS